MEKPSLMFYFYCMTIVVLFATFSAINYKLLARMCSCTVVIAAVHVLLYTHD